MSCSPFDLRDYFLKELPHPQQLQVEAHVHDCPACREELDRLRITEAALFSLRDEEIPQRISFVSDKIFEPSPWRRWWAGFWGSASRLGFASAAMLSAALLVFALTRPAPAPQRIPVAAVQPASAVQTLSEAEIQGRIDRGVAAAVAQSEARQAGQTVKLARSLQQGIEQERQQRQMTEAVNYYLQRRSQTLALSASNYGPPQTASDQPPSGAGEAK